MNHEPAAILYSFRRCPYAMRARMGIAIAGLRVELREVVLRDKPAEMLSLSTKGTVPVLALADGTIIDESIDILKWALAQNDPEDWLAPDPELAQALITHNDGPFKAALDTYKYAERSGLGPAEKLAARDAGLRTLTDLNERIDAHGGQLMAPHRSFADIAIFPFIRQFANTDRDWFDALALPALQDWLAGHLSSALFHSIMDKYARWKPGNTPPHFPIAVSASE